MFLKYSWDIAKNDPVNHQRNIILKYFMKYFCNNEVLFSIILKKYFSIIQETFQKYSKNIPGKDKEIYCWNVPFLKKWWAAMLKHLKDWFWLAQDKLGAKFVILWWWLWNCVFMKFVFERIVKSFKYKKHENSLYNHC